MQDSLCGSMGPLGRRSSSKDQFSNQPSSPSLSTSGDLDTGMGYPGSKGMAPQSPESPNLSSWIDMIDELIEPPPESMLTSPSRDSTADMTPTFSSVHDNWLEKQQTTATIHAYFSMEPPRESMLASPSRDSTSDMTPTYSSFHDNFMEKQQTLSSSPSLSSISLQDLRLPSSPLFSQHEAPHRQQTRSHASQFMPYAGQPQHHQSMSSRIASISGQKSSFQQSPGAIQKVPSAPQLSQLESARSPRRHSAAPMSLPPTIQSLSSPQSILHNRSFHSDLSRLSRTSSPDVSGSHSPSSYSNSPPRLPSSLPSMSYLSLRTNQQRGPSLMQQMQQQGAALQQNFPVPIPANGQREMLAGLEQRQHVGMVNSMSSSRRFQTESQDSGLRLVHLLLACAEAVAREDYFSAKDTLLQLHQVVSTNGDSMQRVAAYFTDALHSRLTGTGNRSYRFLRSYDPASSDEVLAAYQILYQACPYIKFAHFTSNQAIFEAFEGEERVHIVDLDIVQGYQWPAFIQALAARPGGAPHLRITGVGMPLESVQETGKRLTELAESLHVPFEFHAVGERLENLKSYMLQRRIGEALAVNSVNRLHRILSEPMSPVIGILHMIREQAPNIFTLVEQEASHNGPFFLGRFLEALHYYSAIFDSLDATLPQNNPERTKVEQLVFSQEITNIVACEGSERVERHEKLEKWRKMMEGIGFQNVPLSANAVNQSKLLLGLYPCDGYTLVEDRGCLLLGWQDRPIIGASAWRC